MEMLNMIYTFKGKLYKHVRELKKKEAFFDFYITHLNIICLSSGDPGFGEVSLCP